MLKCLWYEIVGLWNRFSAWIVNRCAAKLSSLNISFGISREINLNGNRYTYNIDCEVGNYWYETGWSLSEAYCYLKAYFRFKRYKKFSDKYKCGMPIAVEVSPDKDDLHPRPKHEVGPKVFMVKTADDTPVYQVPFKDDCPVGLIGSIKKESPVMVYESYDWPDKWIFISHTYIDKHGQYATIYGWIDKSHVRYNYEME